MSAVVKSREICSKCAGILCKNVVTQFVFDWSRMQHLVFIGNLLVRSCCATFVNQSDSRKRKPTDVIFELNKDIIRTLPKRLKQLLGSKEARAIIIGFKSYSLNVSLLVISLKVLS